jgi:hypothetical protein
VTYTYAAELDRIKDPELRAELDHSIRTDPRIPTGPLAAWALAYARWRRGDRDAYPAPPSGTRGVTIDGILRVDAIVRDLIEFRPRRRHLQTVDVDDYARPRTRAGDWDSTA